MSSSSASAAKVPAKVALVVWFSALGLAACGGGGGGGSSAAPSGAATSTTTTAVSASATPAMLAYNASAIITWSSTDSTSCSSSPAGISGTAGTYTTPPLTATTTYTITCTGPTGPASKGVTINVAPTSIVNVAAGCAAEPMRGTVYYYCDCGTGAEAGCVAGNDSNAGTNPAAPRRTVANAIARFNALTGTNTIAFCKGGAFNAVGQLSMTNSSCTAGTTCNDLREYAPSWGGTAKPIINNRAGTGDLFSFMGNRGGVRFLNLKLVGDGGAIANRNDGFFFYNGAHDVTMCNLDVDAFDLAFHQSGGNATVAADPNIKLTGSRITNSRTMGYLGSGPNLEISYNYWDGNGGTNKFDHTIYLSSQAVSNVRFIGNHIHGQFGSTCYGVVVTAHGSFDYLTVANNVIDIDTAANTGGCYGMAFGSGGYTSPTYFRHTVFSGNTIRNAGNVGLYVATCPDCVIENNLVMVDMRVGMIGIYAGAEAARPAYNDDVNDRNLIRNNTIWYGPNADGGGIAIKVATEGTGHVVANNTVTYTSTEPGIWGGVRCFDYPLALTSYAFINNNHCSSNATYSWVAGQGNLATWQSYASASGFDTASITGDPRFVAAGTNFTPAAGSPLIGAGNAAHASATDITGKSRPSPPAIGAYEP